MSVKGLVTMWASDLNKIRQRLNDIWLEIERDTGMNPLTKDGIVKNINIIFRLLGKGRAGRETIDEGRRDSRTNL